MYHHAVQTDDKDKNSNSRLAEGCHKIINIFWYTDEII